MAFYTGRADKLSLLCREAGVTILNRLFIFPLAFSRVLIPGVSRKTAWKQLLALKR